MDEISDDRLSANPVFSTVLKIRDTKSMDDERWQEEALDTEPEQDRMMGNQSIWLLSDCKFLGPPHLGIAL